MIPMIPIDQATFQFWYSKQELAQFNPSTAQELFHDMTTLDKQTSIGGSFQIANQAPPRRLVIALDGLEKEGKTHFSLSGQGPIAYLGSDIGDEGVVEKFQTSKLIHRADYGVSIPKNGDIEQTMKLILPEWERMVTDYKLALSMAKVGKVRTIVWDTASEFWEMLRLARFGKLTQVMPHHYTGLNTEYRNLVREVFNTPANLILLHKLKKEWLNDPLTGKGNKTGAYERAGYSDTGFLVQVNALAWREKDPQTGQKTGPFHITLRDCRQNPQAAGVDLNGVMASFPWVGVTVYPDSNLEDWE